MWKDIEGYEGIYAVSTEGRVKSLVRRGRRTEKFLKPSPDKDGYTRVCLSKETRVKHYKVHRLVAIAFISNPENKEQVNHLNGIKDDNRVENLAWSTGEDNIKHAHDIGLITKGEEHPSYKGAIEVYKDNTLVTTIYGGQIALKAFGLLPSSVSSCLTGKLKTHKGYTFKRIEKH